MVDQIAAALVEDVVMAIIIDQTDGATADAISDSIQLAGRVPTMVYMPSTWTAATMGFDVSHDGTTFVTLEDTGGTEIAITVAASLGYALDASVFRGAKYLKIRSGSLATPVDQLAARTLQVAFGNPTGIS